MVTRNRVKWTMLRIYLINLVLVLVLASTASAVRREWDDGADPNELWTAAANWTDNTVPTITEDANINMADTNSLIDSTVDACCATLIVGHDKKTCYLNMTGGTLTSSGTLIVGSTTDSNGVFRMSGGTARTTGAGADLRIGYGTGTAPTPAKNTFGTLIMTGGVMNINGTKIEVGKNDTGVGQIYMQGGTLNLHRPGSSADLELGKYGDATMVMTAGDVNIFDAIKLSESGGTATIDMDGGSIDCNGLTLKSGTPTIYLDGGDVNTNNIDMAGTNAKIDITEGELIVRTDSELLEIRGYISDGKIIGYHGDGYATAELYGGVIHVTARLSDPNLAWKPSPGNYATAEWTPAGPTLSWKPGRYEAKHDVYFGTDEDDVNDANDPNTLPGRGRQDPCSYSFPAPLPPVLGQTYYWRIDEVNDACAPYIWKGNVWQFTMADYEKVEDFNSYETDTALEAVWKLTGTGSNIDINDGIVRAGKSMKYEYTSGSATEVNATTTGENKLPVDINDWTTVGIKALTLYFYGDGTNAAEKMYVALRSTDNKLAVVYYDDPNDINEPEWHEWNIKLSDFTDVNLRSIDKVYIGFGKRENPPTNGGTVYFDDIRLYHAICVASLAPEGDTDGDCDVDFDDVSTMATDWLDTDYNGVGRDGVLKGGASWVNDGERGRCIQLDGTNGWVDLNDSGFSNFRNKTIAFWVKVRDYPTSYPYMFYFSNGDVDNPYRIYFQTYTPATWKVRVRFGGNGLPNDGYSSVFTAGLNVWSHLAFVLEDTADGKCTGKFYGDGDYYGPDLVGRPRHSGGAVGVNLGSANDGSSGFVNAVFDDFRVYDKALTYDDVQELFNGGEPDANMLLHYTFNETTGLTAPNSSTYKFYHPLLSDAELYKGEAKGSRVVNSKDFAILADSWLKEQLWP
jgi:hypothetical protein